MGRRIRIPFNLFRNRVACVLAWIAAAGGAWGQRQAVEASGGMVVAATPFAAEAGADILRRGGNAADAAVATACVLAVTYPRAGSLGGGGFLLVRRADGTASVVDYRETAPAAATRGMFATDEARAARASLIGHRAVGVPGTVAGLAETLAWFGSGRFTWAELLEPARRLAADGFPVSPALARDLRTNTRILGVFPETRRIFLRDGATYAAGELFVQPELAATFARLQADGPREFYEGETARLLATDMALHGGLVTQDDLRAYRVALREPLRGTLRGHEIVTMPPPSSGGVALLQMLAMVDVRGAEAPEPRSAARYHLLAEVMRRAFRDRAAYLGDPAFADVPVGPLLDPAYLAARAATIDPARATPSAAVGPGLAPAAPGEGTDTTHFSIVDRAGNAVANTFTINGLYGSGVTVPGAGFLLNNEMDDFTAAPGEPNAFGLVQGEANAVAPGKRPLSSMTPTIVVRDGRVVLVLGSPGGSTIINTVLQVVLNVVEHGMPVQQAVEAPRVHHQWMPDQLLHEPYLFSQDTLGALAARGHALAVRSVYWSVDDAAASRFLGDVAAVAVDPATGVRLGAADPRSPDATAAGHGDDVH